MVRGVTVAVRRSLVADFRRKAEEAAMYIRAFLEPSTVGEDPYRVYAILKRWCQHESARAPNHSWTDIEKVRGDFQNLYHREDPHTPGLPLATHAYPSKMNDEVPLES